MASLPEKYRPRTLDEIVGQAGAVALARAEIAAGVGGQAYWISGPTGTGKTTLARILAGAIADPFFTTEYYCADDVTAQELDRIRDSIRLGAGGKGGRAWIINESHGLRAGAIRVLLGLLEDLPPRVVFVFTTTLDGMDKIADDQIDANALLHRCTEIRLTSQGMNKPGAARLLEIARAEGWAHVTPKDCERMMKEAKNSMRGAIEALKRLGRVGALEGSAAA